MDLGSPLVDLSMAIVNPRRTTPLRCFVLVADVHLARTSGLPFDRALI